MIIDTHTHYLGDKDFDYFLFFKENPEHILVLSGYDRKSNEKVLEIIEKYSNIYGTIGYHPGDVDDICDSDIDFLARNLDNPKIVAVGEIGLDYHYDTDDTKKQQEIFKKQLKLAEKNNLPVVIHNRDANEDVFSILREFNVKGNMHCFSGTIKEAKEYIDLGYKIGVGGVITFKNSTLWQVVKEIGIKNIVLETDVPYLAPVPYRGKINKYKYIKLTIDKISEIIGVSKDVVIEQTCENTLSIFDKMDIKC